MGGWLSILVQFGSAVVLPFTMHRNWRVSRLRRGWRAGAFSPVWDDGDGSGARQALWPHVGEVILVSMTGSSHATLGLQVAAHIEHVRGVREDHV